MLSIIIPTLNEEDYLPALLDSIRNQGIDDYEVIVSDAGSTDKTLQIAKKYNSIIVQGGLPARGRNNGAQVARGDILFFLDADTILSDHFLKVSLREFNDRNIDMASFCLVPYPRHAVSSLLMNMFYNKVIVMLESLLPHSAVGVLIKKELFEKLRGYDESITLAEDHDLGRRAKKQGKFGILRSAHILVSDRRFRKEGWANIGIKYLLCELHTIFIGPVRSHIFNYKFNHYKDKK